MVLSSSSGTPICTPGFIEFADDFLLSPELGSTDFPKELLPLLYLDMDGGGTVVPDEEGAEGDTVGCGADSVADGVKNSGLFPVGCFCGSGFINNGSEGSEGKVADSGLPFLPGWKGLFLRE